MFLTLSVTIIFTFLIIINNLRSGRFLQHYLLSHDSCLQLTGPVVCLHPAPLVQVQSFTNLEMADDCHEQMCCNTLCGCPLSWLTDNWTSDAVCRHTIIPVGCSSHKKRASSKILIYHHKSPSVCPACNYVHSLTHCCA